MALSRRTLSTVLSNMLDWGLIEMLDAEAHRCMRAVCSELRYAVDVALDTLTLRLTHASCKDILEEQDMALYQCSQHAAKQLHGRMSTCMYGKQVADSLEAYVAQCAAHRLRRVKHCQVIATEGMVQVKPFISLLQALPSLDMLSMWGVDLAPPKAFVLLAECSHLRTLVLSPGLSTSAIKDPDTPVLMTAVEKLEQLRVLGLDWNVECKDLASLSSMPQLGRLCVRALLGSPEGASLPSTRTLAAISSLSSTDSWPKHGSWHPRVPGRIVQADALAAFPNLLWLEGLEVHAWGKDTLLRVPAALQRFSSSAHDWVWCVQLDSKSSVQEANRLHPGCLTAVRNLKFWCSLPPKDFAASLAGVLAAAPHVEALCLVPGIVLDLDDVRTLLQPLEQATCLRALWVVIPDIPLTAPSPLMLTLTPASMLKAAASYLTKCATNSSGNGRSRCPSLKHISFSGCDMSDWLPELELDLSSKHRA